jgi:hypothetical protein
MNEEINAENCPIKAVLTAGPTIPRAVRSATLLRRRVTARDRETGGKVADRRSGKWFEDEGDWSRRSLHLNAQLAQKGRVAAKGMPDDRVS